MLCQGLTHTEYEVIVRLVVDLVQDVEHVDGEVSQRTEVGGDALLSLCEERGRSLCAESARVGRLRTPTGDQPGNPRGA